MKQEKAIVTAKDSNYQMTWFDLLADIKSNPRCREEVLKVMRVGFHRGLNKEIWEKARAALAENTYTRVKVNCSWFPRSKRVQLFVRRDEDGFVVKFKTWSKWNCKPPVGVYANFKKKSTDKFNPEKELILYIEGNDYYGNNVGVKHDPDNDLSVYKWKFHLSNGNEIQLRKVTLGETRSTITISVKSGKLSVYLNRKKVYCDQIKAAEVSI